MSLGLSIALFLGAAVVVVRAGTSLAAAGDQIAESTGLGRLFVGTLLLAFATSLPEIVTDVTAAATGAPDLAVADLFGSSMANMAILAIIDLRYRGPGLARGPRHMGARPACSERPRRPGGSPGLPRR